MKAILVFLLIIFSANWIQVVQAQTVDYFFSVKHESVQQTSSFMIRIQLTRTSSIEHVMLRYRSYGFSEYKMLEMQVEGNSAFASIPEEEVIPPLLEYYVELSTINGEIHTYPKINPEHNPLFVEIHELDTLKKHTTILSPQENEIVRFEDLVISIDIFDLPKSIDKKKTKLSIDGKDLTEHLLINDEIIVCVPANIRGLTLPPGNRKIVLEFYQKEGPHSQRISWDFNIYAPYMIATGPDSSFQYNISFNNESRSESVHGKGHWYNRSNLTFEGKLPWVTLRSNFYLTNEEKSFRQPQNRYSLVADTKWFRLAAGDMYPNFSTLIMNGRRLRGVSGSFDSDLFKIDYVTGQTVRAVDGRELERMPADTLSETGQMIVPPPNSQLVDNSTYAIFSYGTYKRTLTAIRPRFNRGDFMQIGFTYLHSKDDINSIDFGVKPAENLVIGSDVKMSFDDRKLEFVAQIAGSILNKDISNGNLAREDLNDLLGEDAFDELEKVVKLSTLQKIITINQYLVPFDPLKGSSLAYEVGMRANYADNYLQIGYIRRGNDYHSFGLTALRKDIAGFQLRDRLRLMDNQLYIDLSIERLRDNLNEDKTFTTHFSNYNAAISYYPRHYFPRITIGYATLKNDNRVDSLDSRSDMAIRDVTNRFFSQVSHNFLALGIRHAGSFSVVISKRDDQTRRNADIDILTATSMINSYFTEIPLKTSIGLGMYLSEIPREFDHVTERFIQSSFNYYNFIFSGEYRLLNDELNINLSFIPTLKNYTQTAYQLGARYMVMENIAILFQVDYLAKSKTRNDIISNFIIRYDM